MAITLSCEKLIVVEGGSDKALFNGLLNNRNIIGFDVLCPWDMEKGLEGEDAIRHLLDAIVISRNFEKLQKILIVIDSDDNPDDKFKKFQAVLSKTKPFSDGNRYPIPNNPNEFSPAGGGLQVAIQLLPTPQATGAMETLCWNAAIAHCQSVQSCIDEFANCVGAHNWSPQKLAKFKLRSLISTQHQSNPDLPTTYLWEQAPTIVPLESNIFDPLAEFLANL